ncbi:MAG: glycogen/starch synthase [Bacteroidetes bacterium]|jgi:starch synthase|nr:glycogen/starch synthase [Bacteroidota bacterium]MBT4400690.1 glycogen/starch synthase [Bacteroidota bacterium]MBT4408712.1 glycogen/starch synthase [Bacteroidota bacterium]MBT5424708.1 glycogen/starch synthase [Bacteroidota bacterium]MBT7092378.1 glycogen/starch synthase [Bacteroidota bacterium]
MKKQRILYVSQEITPYLPETEMSIIGRYLPQGIQERGREIRTFLPKYGHINERRNQLHEVIRLSGMNLIINDTDHPLIIKVASIQAARMQVYFIDNEDYFHRKGILGDEKSGQFSDNDERLIFYARGVLETVRKLRWAPDLVHCHGVISSVIPLYLKRSFAQDPLFNETKVVISLYDQEFEQALDPNFKEKVMMEGINSEDVDVISKPDINQINKLAVDYADGIILGSANIKKEVVDYVESSGKPTLTFQDPENYVDKYSDFYDQVIGLS